jgi:hypothetical protein
MKKLLFIPVVFLFFTSAVVIPKRESASLVEINTTTQLVDLSKITFEQFINLSPRKIKEITGEDLTTKEKLVLSLMQKDVKRGIKKNIIDKEDSFNFEQYFEEGKNKFNIGGFVLGLLLGLIGVGLAHIFSTDKSFRRSSWQGFGTWVLLLIALGIIISV